MPSTLKTDFSVYGSICFGTYYLEEIRIRIYYGNCLCIAHNPEPMDKMHQPHWLRLMINDRSPGRQFLLARAENRGLQGQF